MKNINRWILKGKLVLTVDLHLEPQPPKIGCGHVTDNFKSKHEDKFDLPTISLLLQGRKINTHNNKTLKSNTIYKRCLSVMRKILSGCLENGALT